MVNFDQDIEKIENIFADPRNAEPLRRKQLQSILNGAFRRGVATMKIRLVPKEARTYDDA